MNINVARCERTLKELQAAGDAGMGLYQLAAAFGEQNNSGGVHARLRTLIQAGYVMQERKGQPYRATAAGLAWLATEPAQRVITDTRGRKLHATDRGMPLRDTPSVRHAAARTGDAPRGLVNSVFALGGQA